MSGILLPEVVIYKTLESIVSLIRKDLTQHSDNDKDTILYRILGVDEAGEPIQMNLYNYFLQAKKMFSVPSNFKVNFGYNLEVAKMISFHILLPSETATAAIGEDEGYISDVERDPETGFMTGIQPYFTQMYESTYQILISSNNSSEVNVAYNVLKSMLLMVVPHLELMGLRIPSLSGNDIVMQEDLTPVPIFHKALNLSFKYEHNVPQLLFQDVAKRFHFEFRMVPYHEEQV